MDWLPYQRSKGQRMDRQTNIQSLSEHLRDVPCGVGTEERSTYIMAKQLVRGVGGTRIILAGRLFKEY